MRVLADGWLSQHGVHTLTVIGPAVLIALLALGADARAWLNKRGRSSPSPVLLVAAALSVAVAAVHGAVCPEHFHEGMLYGVFFAAATAAQLLWAGLAILRPSRWVLVFGLAGNLAILTLWLVTRTAGIPLGPEAGEVEPIGPVDVTANLFEVGIVICCVVALAARRHNRVARRSSDLATI
jgi:hypothetical protein